MNAKDILLIQMNSLLENTWFVSLLNSIDGLTEDQANWKPSETSNSISEIVNHLIFYNQRYLNRFKNIPNEKSIDNNTFRTKEDLNWNDIVKKITSIISEWKKVFEEADVQTLDDSALELSHLTAHTTYHTGQILYIRKLQGIWNPKNGVIG